MRCATCGVEVAREAVFCPKCGAKIGAAPTAVKPIDQSSPSRTQIAGEDLGEAQLWSGGYSGKAMIGSWLLAGIVSVGLVAGCVLMPPGTPAFLGIMVLIWLSLAVVVVVRKLNIHYELTSQRFIHRSGILTRTSDRIEMIDIDDVAFTQRLVERMFNVGSIRLSSSDQTHPILQLKGIEDVKRVADLIDDARRSERRKRGLHIENI